MPRNLQTLIDRNAQRTLVVGIFDLVYGAQPLAMLLKEVSVRGIGIDTEKNKVTKLNAGEWYLKRLTPDLIRRARDTGFEATSDSSRSSEADALIICAKAS